MLKDLLESLGWVCGLLMNTHDKAMGFHKNTGG